MFVCVHLPVLWECAEVLLTEVTCIYLQGFSPLTLLYMNSDHGEGVEMERAGENCNNFLFSFLSRLVNTSMMEGRRRKWREREDGGWRDSVRYLKNKTKQKKG